MVASVQSICNRSLLSVGARSNISNLTEGSTESDACSVLFVPTFESLARTAPWGCLRAQVTLTLIAAAAGTPENVDGTSPLPPSPWLYQYAYPSDCLQIRYLVPSFPNPSTGSAPLTTASLLALTVVGIGQIPFAVAYATDNSNNPIETILTNQTQAQAVYTVNQSNPVIWDSLFQSAMVASLAAYLVPALSLDIALMDRSIKAADSMISLARVRDGNEGTVSQNRNAQWMDARMAGGSLAWSGLNGAFSNYDTMAWPSG